MAERDSTTPCPECSRPSSFRAARRRIRKSRRKGSRSSRANRWPSCPPSPPSPISPFRSRPCLTLPRGTRARNGAGGSEMAKSDQHVAKSIFHRSTTPTSGSGKKDTIYERLPGSLKSEMLVRVKDADPEKTKQRQELIRSKSPHELSQITSPSEFPVPSPIQHLFGGRYASVRKTSTCIYTVSHIPIPS